MLRMNSVTSISLLVITVSAAALGLVPALRERVHSAMVNQKFSARLREQAAERPDDPQVWLAFTVGWPSTGEWQPPSAEALDRVAELRPDWPVPFLLYGGIMAGRVSRERPEAWAALVPDDPTPPTAESEALSAWQREALQPARDALQKARSLDPDNAAPDYLLAHLALVEHRDDDAMALLRSALTKNRWNLGWREARIATYETNRHAVPDFEAAWLAGHRIPTLSSLRALGTSLAGLAVLARERGDHQQAILLREAAIHLGSLMSARAYTTYDVYVADYICRVAALEPLTQPERVAATKGLPKPKSDDSRAVIERRLQAYHEAERAKLARYLREHGRADLAERATSLVAESDALKQEMSAALERGADSESYFDWAHRLGRLLVGSGAAMGLLALCGLVLVILQGLGRRPVPVRWARWKWALVGLLSLAMPFVIPLVRFGSKAALFVPAYADLAKELEAPIYHWGRMFAQTGLPFLVVSALVVTWLARRHDRPAVDRPGFGRQYVGTLTAVLAPLVALLLVACVALSVPLAVRAKEMAGRYKTMIYDGELD